MKLRKLKLFHGCRKTGIVVSLSGNTKYIISWKTFFNYYFKKKTEKFDVHSNLIGYENKIYRILGENVEDIE